MIDASKIDAWVFDLDNTLYHPRANLFGQIDVRMGEYVARLLGLSATDARAVQKRYFMEHGTTLCGLMANHQVDPHDFLDYVHDIDLTVLDADARLDAALARLPGRKIIFTNADGPYARRVLERLGIAHHFDGLHDILSADFVPKPERAPYDQLLSRFDIDARRALFFEDMARNLRPAKALGMTTVWVNNGSEKGAVDAGAGHIDHETDDVAAWLDQVMMPA
ncbi:pyrimidine 5'-nucleotidase [Sphingosinicellaceae bacterium M-36]